jgi:hypothetical protein
MDCTSAGFLAQLPRMQSSAQSFTRSADGMQSTVPPRDCMHANTLKTSTLMQSMQFWRLGGVEHESEERIIKRISSIKRGTEIFSGTTPAHGRHGTYTQRSSLADAQRRSVGRP